MKLETIWCPNGGRLVVAIPEWGLLVRCETATDTFVEVLKRIGLEDVRKQEIQVAGIPLIAMEDHGPKHAQRRVDRYYIRMGQSPESMANLLKRIAKGLEITLYAELFPLEPAKGVPAKDAETDTQAELQLNGF